ncbi:MAG TPA: hypothetical protein VFE46_05995 [Pirellulales bacterium]|nr:hypothetical protein [Pirellulales bacterium]
MHDIDPIPNAAQVIPWCAGRPRKARALTTMVRKRAPADVNAGRIGRRWNREVTDFPSLRRWLTDKTLPFCPENKNPGHTTEKTFPQGR